MSTSTKASTGVNHDNLRHVVITSTCFAFILSTTAVIWEWGISIAGIVLLYNGLGTHIEYVKPEQLVTLFTGSILYTLCVASIKLSTLMLYKRLFPVKSMRTAVQVVSLIIILWAACGILAGCFLCIPTDKLWNPMIPGGCMDLAKFYYGLQIPNIVTDAIILVMPMHIVWSLPISKAQKTGLSIIFILGLLTLIFDIIRLVALVDLSKAGNDITYTQVNSSVWTCIEPAVGIVAACLTNMRPLFKLAREKVWMRHAGSAANSSQQEIVGENGEKRWTRDMSNHTSSTCQSQSPRFDSPA
ncbi:hypothetical protein N7539_003980 [Penicillium diatomitis]|uniref:Rhodopsin domain-containing protein n=1 Tax=Penicillium diatomitis TaxID=2819901 RepID=A0A9W9XCX7_9EURO|nr:uncharacterized protein N7539_003980 [Penicillium diatomitis]KAJ5489090.1 hypothetical protein N7539_003980 [Penicillium diatomitis]